MEQEDLVDCISHLKGYENMKLHCPVNRARIQLRGTINIKLINFRTLVLNIYFLINHVLCVSYIFKRSNELTINVHDIILTHIDIFNWKRSKIANYKLIQKA